MNLLKWGLLLTLCGALAGCLVAPVLGGLAGVAGVGAAGTAVGGVTVAGLGTGVAGVGSVAAIGGATAGGTAAGAGVLGATTVGTVGAAAGGATAGTLAAATGTAGAATVTGAGIAGTGTAAATSTGTGVTTTAAGTANTANTAGSQVLAQGQRSLAPVTASAQSAASAAGATASNAGAAFWNTGSSLESAVDSSFYQVPEPLRLAQTDTGLGTAPPAGGYSRAARPGSATQAGPGVQQSAGPGSASQSGPGFQQSAGPGYASQSGPGFSQSAGPGYVSQSGPFFAQSVDVRALAPLLVAGVVVGEILSSQVVATDLSPQARETAQSMGFQVQEARLSHLGLDVAVLKLPSGMKAADALGALHRADPAGHYDLDAVYRLAEGGTSCVGIRCYGQKAVGMEGQSCAVHARIGMVDGAINAGQPALAARPIKTRRFGKGTPNRGDRDHGTAVAALLVGAAASDFPGLLPGADLVAADVFSADADGHLFTDAASLVQGLDWVAGEQPSVVNISIAGPDSHLLSAAISALNRSGILVAAAAGNLGPRGAPQYPAAYADVLAVTAVDRNLGLYPQANQGGYIAIAAPGVGIWTAGEDGTGRLRDGTSFAVPFATAALALLKVREPALSGRALIDELRAGAKHLGNPVPNAMFGSGLLQLPSCSSAARELARN